MNIALNASIVTCQATVLGNSKGLYTDRLQFAVLGHDAVTLIAMEKLPKKERTKSSSEINIGFLKSIWWVPVTITTENGKTETVLVNRNSALKRLKRLGFKKSDIETALKSGSLDLLMISYKAHQLNKKGKEVGIDLSPSDWMKIAGGATAIRSMWLKLPHNDHHNKVLSRTDFIKTSRGTREVTVSSFNDVIQLTVKGMSINFDFPEFSAEIFSAMKEENGSLVKLAGCQLGEIYSFLRVNKEHLLEVVKESKEGLHLIPSETGLARAIEIYPNGKAVVILNQADRDSKFDGGFKGVSIAIDLDTGRQLISSSSSSSLSHELMERGIEIQERLKEFPWIVKTEQTIEYTSKKGKFKRRALAKRYNLGNLHDAIQNGKLTKEEREKIAAGLISAISDLHRKGYLHRDLKSENILVNRKENGEVEFAIIDFDFACGINEEDHLRKMCGTTEILPPEYILADDPFTQKMNPAKIAAVTNTAHDVWGLGCILFELLEMKASGSPKPGILPWEVITEMDEQEKQIKICRHIRSLGEGWLREPADKHSLEYITWKMLQVNPRNRISACEAVYQVVVNSEYQKSEQERFLRYEQEAQEALRLVQEEMRKARQEQIEARSKLQGSPKSSSSDGFELTEM